MGGGGGPFGKVTDSLGITNHEGQRQDQKRADELARQSIEATKLNIAFQREQFEFQKEQYNDWNAIYGDLQKNLGDFYKNMSADTEIAKIDTNLSLQLQNIAQEYSAASRDLQRQTAQSGIEGSGIVGAMQTQMAQSQAQDRSQARTMADIEKSNADELVAQKQMGFLGLGLGQGTAMLGTMTSQAGNVGSAYGLQAGTAAGLSNNYMQRGMFREDNNNILNKTFTSFGTSFGQSMGQGLGGGAAGGILSDIRLKENLKLIANVEGFNIYEWDWNKEALELGLQGKAKGVIAQELLQHNENLVLKHSANYLMVDYAKLPDKVKQEIGGNYEHS